MQKWGHVFMGGFGTHSLYHAKEEDQKAFGTASHTVQ